MTLSRCSVTNGTGFIDEALRYAAFLRNLGRASPGIILRRGSPHISTLRSLVQTSLRERDREGGERCGADQQSSQHEAPNCQTLLLRRGSGLGVHRTLHRLADIIAVLAERLKCERSHVGSKGLDCIPIGIYTCSASLTEGAF